jgi:hypothetical protein
MCRSSADGGRRCPGSGSPLAGHSGDNDQPESYQGTPWQGYDEHTQRTEELNRRIYEGETITGIMSADVAKRAEERIAQIAREGW